MNSLTMSILILACVFGGALLGMLVRALLPHHHLSAESRDVIKLGTGLIGTMAALVLGLLVSATKGAYDTEKGEVMQMSANIVLLDRVLTHYGPETRDARDLLRRWVAGLLERIWWNGPPGTAPLPSAAGESLYDSIHRLVPTSEAQRAAQSEAQSICTEIARTRLLLFEQQASSLSMPMLIILVFWLSAIFASFGLLASPNATIVVTLLVCALSVSGAMFLILEMDEPFTGIVQITSTPMQRALEQIGR